MYIEVQPSKAPNSWQELNGVALITDQLQLKWSEDDDRIGGYGVVYSAEYQGKTVAVKKAKKQEDTEMQNMLLDEGKMLASVQHENVVTVRASRFG